VSPVDMNCFSMDPSTSAFNHRGFLTPSSIYCKRLNSRDGHLGGGPATTTSSPRSCPLSSGGSPALRPPASSPKRNGTSLEGHRCGNVMHTLASLWLIVLCLAQHGGRGLWLLKYGSTEKLVSTSSFMDFCYPQRQPQCLTTKKMVYTYKR
jgi:hypothetical protein